MMLSAPARTLCTGLSSSFSMFWGGISMNSLASAKTCPMRTPMNTSPSPYWPSPILKYRRYFSRCTDERYASSSSTNRSALGFSGMPCSVLSVFVAVVPPRSGAGICRLTEDDGHLVEALLHAGCGQVARLFGRVAVLGDGHLRTAVACGLEGDHVGHVMRDTRRHAHRGGVDVRPVFVREVGDELDPLVRVNPSVGPRVIHILTAVLRRRAHTHQRRTAHAKIHLGAGGRKPCWPPPPRHVRGIAPGLPGLLDRSIEDAGDDDIERLGTIVFIVVVHDCQPFPISHPRPGPTSCRHLTM